MIYNKKRGDFDLTLREVKELILFVLYIKKERQQRPSVCSFINCFMSSVGAF